MPNQNILRRIALNNSKMRNSAAVRAAEDSILSCIKTSDSPNSTYGLDDFNMGMMWATTTGSSVGSVASAVRNRIERITGADTHHRTTPTDEWFNGILSKTDKTEMMNDFASSVRVQLDVMHELGQVAKEGMTIAIDMHLIPRWDKKPGMDLARSRRKNGTGTFERYITAQCVDDGSRLVLGVLHMGALEDVPDFVRSLIAVCRSVGCNIRAVLLDREFFSTRVFEAFEKMGVGYLVPCKNTDIVVGAIAEFAAGRRPAVSELCITNAEGTSVKYTVIMAERKKKRKKSGKEKSDGVDLRPEEKFIGFATNMQLKDSELYSKRWGIETGYRMIEKMRARTRSTNTVSRIFCFLYSVVMFNAWVMINAMLSAVSKPVEKTRKRMTQTQLRIEIIAVLARHEPSSKTPPDIRSLYPC